MAQASEPFHALYPVAAIAQHCSPATSIAGNALEYSQFSNVLVPVGVASTSVAVHSADAYESCHTAGNTGTRACTSSYRPRAKSHSALMPAQYFQPQFPLPRTCGVPRASTPQVSPYPSVQYGNAVRQSATPPPTATPPSCFNCGATDHLARACPMNLGCSVVCYTCGGAGHISRVCPSRFDQLCTSENVAPTPIVLNASPGVEEPGGTKLNAPPRQSCRPEVYVPPD